MLLEKTLKYLAVINKKITTYTNNNISQTASKISRTIIDTSATCFFLCQNIFNFHNINYVFENFLNVLIKNIHYKKMQTFLMLLGDQFLLNQNHIYGKFQI